MSHLTEITQTWKSLFLHIIIFSFFFFFLPFHAVSFFKSVPIHKCLAHTTQQVISCLKRSQRPKRTQLSGKCWILAYTLGWRGQWREGSGVEVLKSLPSPVMNANGEHPSASRCEGPSCIFLGNRSSSQGYGFKSSTESMAPTTTHTHTHTHTHILLLFCISH